LICLTMIARNEARCLARCLDSAAPFVDEMLVVDTGSTDRTREIAMARGVRVVEFAWVDDFSAARNFALEQTRAPWRLILDADEWIEEGGHCLRELARLDARQDPFVGQVRIQEVHAGDGALRLPPLRVSRFLPQGVRFAGRIHEQAVHRLPTRRVPLTVGHDGYQREQQLAKAGRNEALLRRALEETPQNAYLQYQLGREREIAGDFADAAGRYQAARERLGWPPGEAGAARELQARHPWLHDLAVRHIFSLKRLRSFELALRQAQAESAWWGHSPDFHFALGDLLLDYSIAEPQRSAQLLPLMEACWMRCLELGETPELDGAIEGRGSYLAAHNLAVYHDLLGDAARAAHFRALAAPGHG
jgi:hypothetical protein